MNTVKSADEWDQHYRDRHTPWDHGAPAPAIQEVIEFGNVAVGSEVLVLGCGYGHDVRAFAAAGFAATGLDISEAAMNEARLVSAGENATFIQGDLFDPILPEQKRYDVIWEHTCFCAISVNMRTSYVNAVYNLLKPGGLFVGLFYTDTGVPLEEGPPFNVDRDEVNRLFSPMFVLERENLPLRAYENRIGREWLMRWRRD